MKKSMLLETIKKLQTGTVLKNKNDESELFYVSEEQTDNSEEIGFYINEYDFKNEYNDNFCKCYKATDNQILNFLMLVL